MLERFKKSIADTLRSWSLISKDPALVRMFSAGWDTTSGEAVTPETAMQVTAVYACVQKLSKIIASLPLQLLRVEQQGRQSKTSKATNNPFYYVLHDRWNPRMSSFTARQMMMAQVLLHGNAIAEVVYNDRGAVKEIWPYPNASVRYAPQADGMVRYFLRLGKDQREVEIPAERVLHLKGLALNGAMGLSPIQACRETLGEAIASDKYSQKFYKNNARPGGTIEYDGHWESADAERKFAEAWQKMHGGDNLHKTAILPRGMKYQPFAISHEDAQFLETRKFNRQQIAAIFDLPPHFIGDLERATFSNIEQQSLEFVIYNLTPWLANLEQEYRERFLTTPTQRKMEIKHNVDGLLRGDAKSRWESHQIAYMIGAKSPNEIREQEDWNPREGGDRFVRQVNLAIDDGSDVLNQDSQDGEGDLDNGKGKGEV